MDKSIFGSQPWQRPSKNFVGLGAPGICNATSLDPLPSQILSATLPTSDAPAAATLDTLTPTLVVGVVGFLALVGFGVLKF